MPVVVVIIRGTSPRMEVPLVIICAAFETESLFSLVCASILTIFLGGFLQEDQKKSDALKRDMTRLDEVKTEMKNAFHHAGQGHPKTLWSKFYLKDR